MFSFFRSLLKSFSHAWRGLRLAFRTERSFRIQVAVAVMIMAALLLFPLAHEERIIILLAIAAVLVLELLNSTVERMVDLLKPRLNPYVGDIKDLMAGIVLIASIFAAMIGTLILWPHVRIIFSRV